MIDLFLANGFVELDIRKVEMGRHGVYVLFDETGVVVYVGYGNVGARVRRHNEPRRQMSFVRAAAAYTRHAPDIESVLIRMLRPLYNKSLGNSRSRSRHRAVRAVAAALAAGGVR